MTNVQISELNPISRIRSLADKLHRWAQKKKKKKNRMIRHKIVKFMLIASFPCTSTHNFRFNTCYGVFGWLDRLHGTDELFRNSKASLRNKVLLGTVPLSKSIPEDDKLQ